MKRYGKLSFEQLEEKRALSANQLVAVGVLPAVEDLALDVGQANPDQPILTGSIYHADAMPPYGLPDAKQISGMKTNSIFGAGGNDQLIVDSTDGLAVVRIHAQYDMSTTVEHNDPQPDSLERDNLAAIDEALAAMAANADSVGADEMITVGAAREVTVGIVQ